MRYEEEWGAVQAVQDVGVFRRLHNPVTSLKRVLLIEDDEDLCAALTERLRAVGFDVMVARDGISAIEILRTDDYDAVLLDLGLPRMHGLKVLHRMRTDGEIAAVPVVVLTGSSGEDVERARGYGVYEIHRKPTRAGQIAHSVRDAITFQ